MTMNVLVLNKHRLSLCLVLFVGLMIYFNSIYNTSKQKSDLEMKSDQINRDAYMGEASDKEEEEEEEEKEEQINNESWKMKLLKSYEPVYEPGQYMPDENYIPSDFFRKDLNTHIYPSTRNVTPPNASLLIYNKVPKCGSTTLSAIMKRLQARNKFKHDHSMNHNQQWVRQDEQISLLEMFYKKSKHNPISFDRHMYYFNVTRLGFAKAAWMNFVREPVSRFISQYHFLRKRSVWETVPLFKESGPPPDWWFEMTLDECMQAQRPECRPQPRNEMFLQLAYFCGHHPECRKLGSQWALQRAKRHAENYYSVIGVLEEMPLSFQVFERYLPRFFRDINSLEMSSGDVKMNRGDTKQPQSVSNSTKDIIKEFLKEDIEFYEFLLKRLYLQAEALGLKR